MAGDIKMKFFQNKWALSDISMIERNAGLFLRPEHKELFSNIRAKHEAGEQVTVAELEVLKKIDHFYRWTYLNKLPR